MSLIAVMATLPADPREQPVQDVQPREREGRLHRDADAESFHQYLLGARISVSVDAVLDDLPCCWPGPVGE